MAEIQIKNLEKRQNLLEYTSIDVRQKELISSESDSGLINRNHGNVKETNS